MSTPTPADKKPYGNAAIYYHPDGYVTARERLMGRHAAGEGFLHAFARHARAETLYALAESREHFESFRRQVSAVAQGRSLEWLPVNRPDRLAEPGTVYLPGPDLVPHAWLRRALDPAGYSVVGVTHTICTHRVMDAIGNLLVGPVEEWDALICTSEAVRRGVEAMLNDYGAYLGERLGAGEVRPRVQLPVIPLGVDCERLQGSGESGRRRLRRRHGIGAEDVCVLFFGRLSYHAKAHPMPMYQALETAARETGRRVHLIQAGWFATDAIKRVFVQGARAVCPSVRISYVDGRDQEVRNGIWQAADIFCSLSDNVQETFGLTPVEAMAAGLPVVVSDWDGYRGTVEPGATGFLVPTAIPAAGMGTELAWRHFSGQDSYDQYLGNVCQSVAVDIAATTRAFVELMNDPELRRRMGEAGKERARRLFDWPVIIAAYEELWAELHARRLTAARSGTGARAPAPLRADPYFVFGHYATRVMNEAWRIAVSGPDPVQDFHRLSRLQMNRLGRDLFPADAEIEALIESIPRDGGCRLGQILAEHPEATRARWMRTVAWLAKMGIVKFDG